MTPTVTATNNDSDTQAADIAQVDIKQAAPKTLPTTCLCKANSNIKDEKGKWKFFSWPLIADMELLDVFRMCMPEGFILHTMIPATNKHIEGEHLTMPELYKWLGRLFFMACFDGILPMTEWWSKRPISMFEGAPFRLNELMSLSRFQAINKAIRSTNKSPPTDFHDSFHDMRQLHSTFNDHYAQNYLP
ncbi:hypothetical protein ACHAW6_000758, partial [Cyclotella cf. meneghiniana]